MRYFLINVLTFSVLLLIATSSFSSEACRVVLFGFETEPTIGHYNVYDSTKSRIHKVEMNSKSLPEGSNEDIYIFNQLKDGDKLEVKYNRYYLKSYEVFCSDRKTIFLKINNRDYDLKIDEIEESQAIELLSNYEIIKEVVRKGKAYTVLSKYPVSDLMSQEDYFARSSEKAGGQVEQGLTEQVPFPKNTYSWNVSNAKNPHAIAVIIGNKNYKKHNSDVPDVDFALNDAELIYEYVAKALGYREGNVFYLKDATQTEMIRTFGNSANPKGKLYDWVRPGKSDVFVYYSGHGAPSLTSGEGYLLPVDADPQKVELNGYSLKTFYENLAQIEAKSMTVVLDACFSGSSQKGSVVRNASSIALRRVEVDHKLPNAAVLTAADAVEVASWDTSARNGLFTRFFLDGVSGKADEIGFGNGDGVVTLGELKRYLEDEVTYYARRHYGREQHPQISGMLSKKLSTVSR